MKLSRFLMSGALVGALSGLIGCGEEPTPPPPAPDPDAAAAAAMPVDPAKAPEPTRGNPPPGKTAPARDPAMGPQN